MRARRADLGHAGHEPDAAAARAVLWLDDEHAAASQRAALRRALERRPVLRQDVRARYERVRLGHPERSEPPLLRVQRLGQTVLAPQHPRTREVVDDSAAGQLGPQVASGVPRPQQADRADALHHLEACALQGVAHRVGVELQLDAWRCPASIGHSRQARPRWLPDRSLKVECRRPPSCRKGRGQQKALGNRL